jgi:GGDEF domain-containing protein
VLRVIAERLHEEAPAPELLTRLRGAEFAIVLAGVDETASVEALATQILERAAEPCWTGEQLASFRAIGAVVLADDPHETALHVLHRAARTLHRARSCPGQECWPQLGPPGPDLRPRRRGRRGPAGATAAAVIGGLGPTAGARRPRAAPRA